jgi:hypothetical protein
MGASVDVVARDQEIEFVACKLMVADGPRYGSEDVDHGWHTTTIHRSR